MNKTDRFSFILKPSTIPNAGVGVFVLHDIAKSTYMELFLPDFQEEICDPNDVPKELQIYCLPQKDGKLLCPKLFNRLDIGNYLNHSDKPNLVYKKGTGYFASCDIKAGEELFADYREIDGPEYAQKEYYI